jgi:threonine dehydrogenase-like Zn-dependent dehydrogenase
MKRNALYFTAPRQVELVEEVLPDPGEEQLVIRTLLSAISPGTETLIYRGEVPEEMAIDLNIPSLAGSFRFPFKYGYSNIGEVIEVGNGISSEWLGRRVFSFHPHESAFLAQLSELIPVPEGLSIEDAVFLPNMETALNLVQDGAPLVGEAVAVWGLGVVGLLTTAVLVKHPFIKLVTFDRFSLRRKAGLELGVLGSVDPGSPDLLHYVSELLSNNGSGFDLSFELSGSPIALNQAIEAAGFASRILIGSWYGQKTAALSLGGRFHRSRIRLISSQVSTIAPELTGRWNKKRRFELAWLALADIQPRRWITQHFPLEEAPRAYRLLAENPEDTIQVIFNYQNEEDL